MKSKWITADVLKEVRAYSAAHPGSFAAAYRALKRDYLAGRMIGGVHWKQVWAANHPEHPMPSRCPAYFDLPEGWSCHNLMRKAGRAS